MHSIEASTMNHQGQTKLLLAKQLFIQNFLKNNKIDVLLCQKTHVENETFVRYFHRLFISGAKDR